MDHGPRHDHAISIHPPHAGRDVTQGLLDVITAIFQSTLPMRGGTPSMAGRIKASGFQSTLPMRGGTPIAHWLQAIQVISIHPPHAGRDFKLQLGHQSVINFNPPSPCGEGPAGIIKRADAEEISIHPPHAGRDTDIGDYIDSNRHFNPPSPCGEGLISLFPLLEIGHFNPPSPCGEGRGL